MPRACPSCEHQIADDLSFCTQCGFRLQPGDVEPRPAESLAELVEGRQLSEVIAQQAPLFWRRALELVEDICAAAVDVGAEGLDIGPEQVFIEDVPGKPRRVKLVASTVERLRGPGEPRDTAIGSEIGRIIEKGRQKFGFVGRLDYFPPEKLMGKPLSPATDVYVVGLVAYQLLVGHLPFPDARGPAGLITAQLKRTPTAPSELVAGIPVDVDHVLLKSLHKDRRQRFQDLAELGRALATLTGRGDRDLVPVQARHETLERAIVEAPTQPQNYEVYADWLQQQGDPRGALAVMQIGAEEAANRGDDARASQLRAAANAHLDAHAAFLIGPLSKLVLRAPFEWRFGFIHHVTLDATVDALEAIFAHPSGRFVVGLDLHLGDDPREVLALLATSAPSTLRTLALRSRYQLGDVSPLWPRLRELERLTITARTFELGQLDFPALHALELRAGQMSKTAAAAIARCRCPALQSLQLRVGRSDVQLSHLWPLLARTDLPALDTLAITAWEHAGALCRQLHSGALSRQLARLDLSFGAVDDDQVRALGTQRLPNLRELIVAANGTTDPFAYLDDAPAW